MNLHMNEESVSYQANVDWSEATDVWHCVDGILAYIRYLFLTRNWVSKDYKLGTRLFCLKIR